MNSKSGNHSSESRLTVKHILRGVTLILLLGSLLCSPTAAQKGNKPPGMKPGKPSRGMKGGKGEGNKEKPAALNLPPAFQRLSEQDVKALGDLTRQILGWITDSRSPRVSALNSADFFGQMPGSRRFSTAHPDKSDPASGNDPKLVDQETGFAVLAVLELSQRKQLASILEDHQQDTIQAIAFRTQLQDAIRELREKPAAAKSLDSAAQKILRDAGQLEASMAIRQARAFAELQKSLTREQQEELHLICTSSVTPRPDPERGRLVAEELEQADAEEKLAFELLALRAAVWLTADPQGRPDSADPSPHWLLPELKDSLSTDQLVMAFSGILSPPQQSEILMLLGSEQQFRASLESGRQQVTAAIAGLKSRQPLDERRLRQAVSQLLELEFRNAITICQSCESIRRSLSPAQRDFIERNLAEGQSSKISGNGSGKGSGMP